MVGWNSLVKFLGSRRVVGWPHAPSSARNAPPARWVEHPSPGRHVAELIGSRRPRGCVRRPRPRVARPGQSAQDHAVEAGLFRAPRREMATSLDPSRHPARGRARRNGQPAPMAHAGGQGPSTPRPCAGIVAGSRTSRGPSPASAAAALSLRTAPRPRCARRSTSVTPSRWLLPGTRAACSKH